MLTTVRPPSAPSSTGHLIVPRGGNLGRDQEQLRLAKTRTSTSVFNVVTELVVSDDAHLRYVCGQDVSEQELNLSVQRRVARRASLDWVALGFGSARGRVHGDAARGQGPRDLGRRRLRQPPAPRIDFDRGAEPGHQHDVNLAFQGVAGALDRGLEGQHHRRPGRAEDRHIPGVAQPARLQAHSARRDPGLEIQANDVRCTRSSGTGRSPALFYLRSRGLQESIAKQLVIKILPRS